jgi:hypothetical protein
MIKRTVSQKVSGRLVNVGTVSEVEVTKGKEYVVRAVANGKKFYVYSSNNFKHIQEAVSSIGVTKVTNTTDIEIANTVTTETPKKRSRKGTGRGRKIKVS